MRCATKLGIVAMVALVPQCNLYDPDLIDEGRAFVPPRPSASTSSPADARQVAFAIRDLFLSQDSTTASNFALDLDDRMSVDESNVECTSIEASAAPVIDGPNGADNSLGENLLPLVKGVLPCLEDDIALAQGLGIGTIILSVSKWNGQSDDASIDVSIARSIDGTAEDPTTLSLPGVELLRTADSMPADGPQWDGQDFWWLDPADFIGGDITQPRNRAVGYVSAGRLVVPLSPSTPIVFIAGDATTPFAGHLDVVLSDGWIFGDIGTDNNSLERGAVVGRFGLSAIANASSNIGVCGGSSSAVLTAASGFADVLETPGGGGPGANCDALSLAVPFTAVGGTVAGIGPASRALVDACQNPMSPSTNTCCPTTVADMTAPGTCDDAVYATQPNMIPVPAPDF